MTREENWILQAIFPFVDSVDINGRQFRDSYLAQDDPHHAQYLDPMETPQGVIGATGRHQFFPIRVKREHRADFRISSRSAQANVTKCIDNH